MAEMTVRITCDDKWYLHVDNIGTLLCDPHTREQTNTKIEEVEQTVYAGADPKVDPNTEKIVAALNGIASAVALKG